VLFIVFLAGRHLCFYGALVGKKHCNAFCSCPNAHQLMRGAIMETKMAAGWEYDE
jgi:hypothetical protein